MKKNNINFKGFRESTDDLFRLSPLLSSKRLNHSPFIVFNQTKDEIETLIIDNYEDLILYPKDTDVIAQWRGEWSSNYFKFKVEDVINYINNKNKKDEKN
jgi:hypothetical protein